ncbi:MAG TPA: NADH-quinone oxidoreductase subunit J [Gemmataceae bacterium]|nr:NADH-quinone oxidoreductase subunit J [Gemmataceae bacterium]
MTLLADSPDPLNWTVLLPVLAGGLAVWYLLPSPQKRPPVFGILAGLVALGGVAAFLVRGLGQRIPETVEAGLFFGFSGLAVVFAVLMIINRNPARSALAFAMVVLSTCGLFLLLAAPFLTAATIVIYAGAIIVTFLFVIMLSQQEGPSNANLRAREPALSVAAGFVLLATFLVGLQRVYDRRTVDAAIEHASSLARADRIPEEYLSPAESINVDNMGNHPPPALTPKAAEFAAEMRAALRQVKLGVPRVGDGRRFGDHPIVQDVETAINFLEISGFRYRDAEDVRTYCQTVADGLQRLKHLRQGSAISDDLTLSEHGMVRPVERPDGPRQLPAANVSAIGRTLFADHLLAVELAGTLLLVATIGAIAIAGRRERAP